MNKIIITDGNIILFAKLNNSLSSSDFKNRLPCTLSGLNEDDRYCFPVAKGRYDPMDYSTQLKKGFLTLEQGFFSIYMKNNLSKVPHIVIGQVEPESLPQLVHLPDRMNVYICST